MSHLYDDFYYKWTNAKYCLEGCEPEFLNNYYAFKKYILTLPNCDPKLNLVRIDPTKGFIKGNLAFKDPHQSGLTGAIVGGIEFAKVNHAKNIVNCVCLICNKKFVRSTGASWNYIKDFNSGKRKYSFCPHCQKKQKHDERGRAIAERLAKKLEDLRRVKKRALSAKQD